MLMLHLMATLLLLHMLPRLPLMHATVATSSASPSSCCCILLLLHACMPTPTTPMALPAPKSSATHVPAPPLLRVLLLLLLEATCSIVSLPLEAPLLLVVVLLLLACRGSISTSRAATVSSSSRFAQFTPSSPGTSCNCASTEHAHCNLSSNATKPCHGHMNARSFRQAEFQECACKMRLLQPLHTHLHFACLCRQLPYEAPPYPPCPCLLLPHQQQQPSQVSPCPPGPLASCQQQQQATGQVLQAYQLPAAACRQLA
jgi:hypothetical protein